MTKEVICARFDDDIIAQIDELIKSGDFGSRGEFVQYAVRKILKNYDKRL